MAQTDIRTNQLAVIVLLSCLGLSLRFEVGLRIMSYRDDACASPSNNVYEDGPFRVGLVEVPQTQRPGAPPKPLLVAAPSRAGKYAILMLQHGFSLKNSFYSQLMQHIASHGFIVVAPQMYHFAGSDASSEISDAAAVVDWIPGNLHAHISQGGAAEEVKPDMTRLAVMGHSRGGKVAFGLALGLAATALSSKISAVVGLDPVDGTSDEKQTPPAILRFSRDSLDLGCPTLIVGAGLGCEKKNLFFPPCAPERVGHKAFFHDCCAPAFLFRAPDQGHMDFLDDVTRGGKGKLTYLVCKNGAAREPMRRFSGGIVVAFLQAVLYSNSGTFENVLANPSSALLRLDAPQRYGELPNKTNVFV